MAKATLESRGRRARTSLPRRVFTFPAMLCGLLVVLAALTVRSRFDDPDMWWHLKLGQTLWTTHALPASDIFSYTTNHHAYIAHEWLSQWIIFAAYQAGGYVGLMAWLFVTTSALLLLGYVLCTVYSGNAKIAFVGALTVWLFATIGLAIRPHMIGYFLLVLELLLIQLGRTRNPRWFLALPPLFAVWVNCHGSFFMGMVVGAIILLTSLFEFRAGLLVASPWTRETKRMLAWCLGFSSLALFFNPVGLRQLVYPLNILFLQPINTTQVLEWQPLQVTDGRGASLLAILACMLLLLLVRQAEIHLDEALLIGLATWGAVSHQRLLFVFGILIAPIFSRLLADAWGVDQEEPGRPLANASLLALSLLIAYRAFPSRAALIRQVATQSPVNAVRFIQQNHLSGPMLNDYIFGGYLIWTAPEHPVFIDGRADIFEWTGVLAAYGRWATLQEDPSLLLDRYHITLCLLSRNSPMTSVMPLLPGWKLAYKDDTAEVFARAQQPTPADD